MIKSHLSFGGQNSRTALCMYVDSEMAYDIDQISLDLCDDDETSFSHSIGACKVLEIKAHKGNAAITIDLPGEDEDLKEQVLEEFFCNFDHFIRPTLLGLQSRGLGRYECRLIGYEYSEVTPALTP